MSLQLQGSLWAHLQISWVELTQYLELPGPASFPMQLPAGDLAVDVFVDALTNTDAGASQTFQLRLEAVYEIPDGFLLHGLTLGRTCRLTFTSKALAHAEDIGASRKIVGTLAVEVAAKLPPLPNLDVLRVHTGDPEGWTRLRVMAEAGTNGKFTLSAEVMDPFQMDVFFPGLPQSKPPLHLELNSIKGSITFEDGKLSGALEGEGEFSFSPKLTAPDIPVVEYLRPMLDDLALLDLSMGVALNIGPIKEAHLNALQKQGATADESEDVKSPAVMIGASLLTGENPEFCLFAKFKNAAKEFDLIDLLRRLTVVPSPIENSKETAIAVGFGLTGICLCISQKPSFAIEMVAKGGVEIPAYLKLSKEGVQVGLGQVFPKNDDNGFTLPLRLPSISREQFHFMKGRPIDKESRREADKRPLDRAIYELIDKDNSNGGKDRYNQLLDLYFNVAEQLSGTAPNSNDVLIAYQSGDNEWKVEPPVPRDNVGELDIVTSFDKDLPLRLAVGLVGVRLDDGTFTTSGDLAVAYQIKGEEEEAWHLLLANPALVFKDFFFSLSFTNPRDIRVGGSVSFAVDGPFSEIKNFTLTVGLSADMVYFSLDVNEKTKIHLPAYKGDNGGRIAIGKLMFGFGYLKRSLAIAFAGELVLPEKLVDDLDTSETLGAGVRLPVQSKLAFQFDLMPIVVKEVVIPVPLFQFNWDLRKDVSPGLKDPRTCEPFWDGLQLIVPNVIRLSLKRISSSPIVFIHAAFNSDFDGDLMLGDSENGLTIVADNIYWIYGLDSLAAVVLAPLVAQPFCDNFCVQLRLGGFGLHFNVQRPIPSFSPLAIFELLALIADPLYEIAPRGELADTVRISLVDAQITLPEPVRRLFPQIEAVLRKPLNVTINLATFLTLFQQVVKTMKPLGDAVFQALKTGERVADTLQRQAAELQARDIRTIAGDMLSKLPPELRKVRMAASFAGFDASAVLVLTDRKGALSAMAGRSGKINTKVPSVTDPNIGGMPREQIFGYDVLNGGIFAGAEFAELTAVDLPAMVGEGVGETHPELPSFMTNPNIRRVPGGPRIFDPDAIDANILAGIEFEGFTAADLDEVAPPPSGALLNVGDISGALVNKLKTDSRPIGRFLRDHFSHVSPYLAAMLSRYGGGLVPDSLIRQMAAELNNLIKGESLYERARFAGVTLEPPLWRLIERHETEPLERQELQRLNRILLEAAYPDELPATVGILIGARVRVFGSQRFRFIGYVFADGAFSLVSAANVDPLRLSIAGIPVPLPFKAEGRLRLAGRAKRDGIIGSVYAEGRANWPVLPGLLYLEIGHKNPAALELFSDGRFAFTADASITLFNNSGCQIGNANVNVSNTHCFVSGSLDLVLGNVAGIQLFDLHAKAEGRIGPDRKFRISFTNEMNDGDVSPSRFCGFPIPSLKGTLSESGAEIEAQLAQYEGIWPGSAFKPPCRINEAVLKGWLNLRKTNIPDFGLEGTMALQLFDDNGPSIRGRGGIASQDGRLAAFAEGTLNWQGRDWLRGRIDLRPDEVRISGDVSLVLSLIPNDEEKVGGVTISVEWSQLIVSVDLSGQFVLDATGRIIRIEQLRAQCVLALRFPSSSNQPLPLAMAEVTAERVEIRDPSRFSLWLFQVSALSAKGLTVKVPIPRWRLGEPLNVATGDPLIPSHPLGIYVPQYHIEEIKDWLGNKIGEKVVQTPFDLDHKEVVGSINTATIAKTPITIPTGEIEWDYADPLRLPLESPLDRWFGVALCLDQDGKKFDLKLFN